MSDSCGKILADKKLTVFFIESATAGYLSHRFSVCPYSGDVLIGGLVCYDASLKKDVLNISSKLLDDYTPESLEVTRELIVKSKTMFDADLHVACTGLLKPGGSETEEKPIGTFFYCIGYGNEIYDFHCICNGPPEQKLRSLNSVICKSIIDVVNADRN